jgi:molybdopterin-guanine dinucleotide biosynthesis protein A
VSSDGRRHHLIALWPVGCAVALRESLSVPGSRRVAHFAQRIGMRYAEYRMQAADYFDNVNTPEELTRARAKHASARK